MSIILQHPDCQLEPREIVRKIIDTRGITGRQLAALTGIDEQSLSKMLNGTRTLTDKNLVKISKALGVPFDTLRFGSDLDVYLNNGYDKEKIGEKDDVGERSSGNGKQVHTDDAPNADHIFNPDRTRLFLSQLPEKDAELYIPFYDIEISAGILELFFDDVDELPEGYLYAPQYRGCVVCTVKGDSMYDLIYPGSRLYVEYVRNKKYIDFGQVYLVILDGMRLLKYVRAHPTDESKVILSSHNKRYDDWSVEKADILHLFLVKGYENQNAN